MSSRATLALVVVVAAGLDTGSCCFTTICVNQVAWEAALAADVPEVYVEVCYEATCSEVLALGEGDCVPLVFPDPATGPFAGGLCWMGGAFCGHLEGITDPRDGDLLLLRVTDGTGRRLIDYYEGLDFQNTDGWPCEHVCPPYAPPLYL